MKAFEHCVEAKTYCKGDCLYYPEQYTKGQPRDSSCLHMTTEKGYTVAKQLLEEHFRNEFNIAAAYMASSSLRTLKHWKRMDSSFVNAAMLWRNYNI